MALCRWLSNNFRASRIRFPHLNQLPRKSVLWKMVNNRKTVVNDRRSDSVLQRRVTELSGKKFFINQIATPIWANVTEVIFKETQDTDWQTVPIWNQIRSNKNKKKRDNELDGYQWFAVSSSRDKLDEINQSGSFFWPLKRLKRAENTHSWFSLSDDLCCVFTSDERGTSTIIYRLHPR